MMGGLSDFIFGSSPSVNKSSDPTKTPEQLELLKMLAQMFQGQVQGGPAAQQDLSHLERTSLAALEEMAMQQAQAAGKPDPTFEAGRNAVKKASDSEVNLDEFNQYFKGAVEDPLMRTFREEAIPELTRRFSGSAAFGSDRRTAELASLGRLGDSLATSRSDALFQTRERAKDRSLVAAGLAPQLGQQNEALQRGNLLLQLLAGGSVPRAARQSNLNQMLLLLGVNPIENTTVVNPGRQGLLSAAAPGAGAALTKYFLGA